MRAAGLSAGCYLFFPKQTKSKIRDREQDRGNSPAVQREIAHSRAAPMSAGSEQSDRTPLLAIFLNVRLLHKQATSGIPVAVSSQPNSGARKTIDLMVGVWAIVSFSHVRGV